MRSLIFVTLAALALVSVHAVGSNCSSVPAAAGNTVWCTDCNTTSNLTDAICGYCVSATPYANKAATACTAQPCSSPPAVMTDAFCLDCKTNHYKNFDGSACTAQTCSAPPAVVTDAFCTDCNATNKFANYNGSACTA